MSAEDSTLYNVADVNVAAVIVGIIRGDFVLGLMFRFFLLRHLISDYECATYNW